MGGGTTLVEGLQLNTRVIGIDINPVAWFVTRKTLEPLRIELLEPEMAHLEQQIKAMKSFYLTQCPLCEEKADVMYFFWVRTVHCRKCKTPVPLYPNFRITTRRKQTNIVFCPQCENIFESQHAFSTQVSCTYCNHSFVPSKGYVTGRGRFSCPDCHHNDSILRAAQAQGNIPELKIYAIEYYCPNDGRRYKKPDSSDLGLFQTAVSVFDEKKDTLPYPRQKIPEGYNYKQATNYGYEYFYQLFNKRQLFFLSTLLDSILAIPTPNIRKFMLLAFSDSLQYNNMFVRYHRSNAKVESMFAQHAYWPPTTTVETNPWGVLGRNHSPQAGSFRRSVLKLRQGKQFCVNPYHLHVRDDGTTRKVPLSNATIEGHLVQTFQELSERENSVLLECQTSENLNFLPDQSVDAVITDPPYFDNVMYSEVSDFFYVWLRIGLQDRFSVFTSPFIPRSREIIVNPAHKEKKETHFFLEGLTNVFREVHRILKDDAFLTFTFHHKNSNAWAAVLTSLLDSGFTIVSVYPIHSEMSSSLHIRDKEACHFDTIITAKKRNISPQIITWEQLRDHISLTAKQLLARVQAAHTSLTEGDCASIVLGKCLELYSQYYPNVYENQQKMGVQEVIQKMRMVIDTISSND